MQNRGQDAECNSDNQCCCGMLAFCGNQKDETSGCKQGQQTGQNGQSLLLPDCERDKAEHHLEIRILVSLVGGHNMLIFFLSMLETDEGKNNFTRLYEKYRKLMFYVANQIFRDGYLSEDAVEQTFVKIIEHLDNISDADCHKTKSYIVIRVFE